MKQPEVRPTLTIRLKPHLQDYLRYILNLEGNFISSTSMVANKSSYLGKLVTPFIEYCPANVNPLLPGEDRNLFTFELPFFDAFNIRHNTAWISDKNQANIQSIIESHFRIHFRVYADDKVRYLREQHTPKGAIKKVVMQFCSDINIKYDDVNYDMIYKSYYRHRKKSLKYSLGSKRTMIGNLFFII